MVCTFLLPQIRIWLTPFEMSFRGLTRNPEIYDEPESFRPERFIDGKPLDPRQLIFGFGRRYICPNLQPRTQPSSDTYMQVYVPARRLPI